MRAVSTVLDVAVFLLLVSAAVATLAVPAADPPPSGADETAEALAATTGNVTYTSGASGGKSVAPTRTAEGTHAELLARAAMANLTLDGVALAPTADPFRVAVATELDTAMAWTSKRVSVAATWEPYPDAPIRGRMAVGARPPTGVDVATATLTVPVPTTAASVSSRASARDYRGVAAAVADALLGPTLGIDRDLGPPAGGPVRRDWERRFDAYATALDFDDASENRTAAVRTRLVDRLASDLRDRYDTPANAAEAVTAGRVRVVVREWSS